MFASLREFADHRRGERTTVGHLERITGKNMHSQRWAKGAGVLLLARTCALARLVGNASYAGPSQVGPRVELLLQLSPAPLGFTGRAPQK